MDVYHCPLWTECVLCLLSVRDRVGVSLELVLNMAEKPHHDADSTVSSVHRWSAVLRMRKPFLSKFITASSRREVWFSLLFTLRASRCWKVCTVHQKIGRASCRERV